MAPNFYDDINSDGEVITEDWQASFMITAEEEGEYTQEELEEICAAEEEHRCGHWSTQVQYVLEDPRADLPEKRPLPVTPGYPKAPPGLPEPTVTQPMVSFRTARAKRFFGLWTKMTDQSEFYLPNTVRAPPGLLEVHTPAHLQGKGGGKSGIISALNITAESVASIRTPAADEEFESVSMITAKEEDSDEDDAFNHFLGMGELLTGGGGYYPPSLSLDFSH